MKFLDIDIQKEIVRLYTDLKYSVLHISKLYCCSPRAITTVLKQYGIKIRSNNYYKRKAVNEFYFDIIDTPEKAYILGFIYADGCITKGNTLEIKLSVRDIGILKEIKRCLNSEHTIGIYENHCGCFTKNKYCMLSIVNQHLYDSLVAYGVTERKTFTLTFPSFLSNVLVSHFVRGFFDGDGSVYECRQNGFIGCSFTGTYDMLEGIRKICYDEFGTNAKVHKCKNKNVYDFKVGGRNNVKALYEYLYRDATIYLSRKKLLFEKYLKV